MRFIARDGDARRLPMAAASCLTTRIADHENYCQEKVVLSEAFD